MHDIAAECSAPRGGTGDVEFLSQLDDRPRDGRSAPVEQNRGNQLTIQLDLVDRDPDAAKVTRERIC
ncbi:hypothetical protein [Mycobacterium sp.]|uniref:hypothetical protein n=1 Tax=Mycobacterium sp. TaxID=1785 RepID=UPI0031DE8F15